MDGPYDVVTFGSATVDVFVETEKASAITKREDGKDVPYVTYRSGEKILVTHLQFEVGGGGTNTAACFSRLGLRTGYVGAIGNDANGRQVQEALVTFDVEFLGAILDEQTNYSVVLDSTLIKDRTILVYKGASEHLHPESVPAFRTRWLYTSSLSGNSFAASMRAINSAREGGTRVAANPSGYQIEHDRTGVELLLRQAHVVVLNRDEASALVGDGRDQDILARVRALGPTIVVITLGARGAIAMDEHRTYEAEPAPDVRVRETTGAGDCFAASFVAALAHGRDVETALRWAFVNVENHIGYIGAKAGLLTLDELERRVAPDARAITPLRDA